MFVDCSLAGTLREENNLDTNEIFRQTLILKIMSMHACKNVITHECILSYLLLIFSLFEKFEIYVKAC